MKPKDNQPTLLSVQVPEPREEFIALDELTENAHGASNRLKATMRAVGQRTPIVVEELPYGGYRIRDGKRRTATARELGWNDIRALVYPTMSESQWALVLAGLHNRAPNPVEEARFFQELGQTLSIEGISANTGHPVQVIRARLALLALPDDILDMVGSKTLALGIAQRAAKLQGRFLARAVQEIRQKHGADEGFTAADLKEITVVRQGNLAGKLMGAAPLSPTLIPAAEVLAAEVRELCERRGVSLSELLHELGITPVAPTAPRTGLGVN